MHAVTGARPFPRGDRDGDSEDPAVRWPQLVREPEPLPQRTPPPLADLLREMLARDPGAARSGRRRRPLEPLVGALPRKISLKRGKGF